MNINISFNKIENDYYNYLFQKNKKPYSNFITGRDLAGLFMKSNLNKEILKKIWDFSSFRKEKELNQQEFYLACRCVKLCQQGIAINENNLISKNTDIRLPQFIDETYQPPTFADDDDEFIEIVEQQEQTPVIKSNDLKNVTNNKPTNHSNYNNKEKVESLMPSSITSTANEKKIEDLFDLLDTKPQHQEDSHKNDIISEYTKEGINKQHNQEHNFYKANTEFSQGNQQNNQEHNFYIVNTEFSQGNQQHNQEHNFYKTNTEFSQGNQFLIHSIKNQNVSNEYLANEDDEFVDIEDSTHTNQSENLFKINNQWPHTNDTMNMVNTTTSTNKIDEEINFQKILTDKNFHPGVKIVKEVFNDISDLTKENESNRKKEEYSRSNNNNKVATLDDLLRMGESDWNPEVDNPEANPGHNSNDFIFNPTNSQIKIQENIYVVPKDNTDRNLSNKEIPKEEDQDEFRDVEDAEDNKQEKNEEPLFKVDFISENKEIVYRNHIEISANIIEEKNHQEQIHKISIINYTPDDFLNEFKKEHMANDDFEFTSVDENHKEDQEENLSDIEYVLKYKLRNSSLEKLNSNSYKIRKVVIEMISAFEESLKHILEFVNNKKFNKYKFQNDRQLDSFFKSMQQILIISCKIFTILSNSQEKDDLKNKRESLLNLLQEVFKVKEEIFNFKKFFDQPIIEKCINFYQINYKVERNKLSDLKICFLCLHDNEYLNESISNIFSFDFHTSCINLWLNKIDKKSPYDLDIGN